MALYETFTHDSPMGHQAYTTIPSISRRRTNHTISDLVNQFHQHTLTSNPLRSSSPSLSISSPSPSPLPPTLAARPHLLATRSASPSRSPSPPSHAAYRRLSASALRAQRQANIRLLSDATHLAELHALVERMVDARDQCRVGDATLEGAAATAPSSPVSSTTTTSSSMYGFSTAESPRAEDEGLGDEMDEDEDGSGVESVLSYRRSGELGVPATVPCVRKDIKVRKRRQRSAGAR